MGYGSVSFTMATPIAGRTARWLLMMVMSLAKTRRDYAPLRRITALHFAGFGLIRSLRGRSGLPHRLDDAYLLFFSLFDGSADAYLADFSALVADQIDGIWGKCVRYPGAREAEKFVHWLGQHALTRERPATPGGAAYYEYQGYRVDPESGAPAARGDARRLAPMPLVEAAIELMLRLEQLEPQSPGDPLPSREELLALAEETL